MKIIIESIPHKNQRYPTCGDWFYALDGTLHIRVSEEMLPLSGELVAVHELVEALLCQRANITQDAVDEFDTGPVGRALAIDSEPGDDERAPYHKQHCIATGIERILAAEMDIAWVHHEDNVNRLPYD
jgi:hypothetical protein